MFFKKDFKEKRQDVKLKLFWGDGLYEKYGYMWVCLWVYARKINVKSLYLQISKHNDKSNTIKKI